MIPQVVEFFTNRYDQWGRGFTIEIGAQQGDRLHLEPASTALSGCIQERAGLPAPHGCWQGTGGESRQL